MNKTKQLLTLVLGIFTLLFTSCEVEPLDPSLINADNSGGNSNNNGGGGNNGGGNSTSIVGTYILTAYNSSVPTDLNNNGISSTNQMNEHSCFNDMFLTLNSNNTFNANARGIEINTAGTATDCYIDPDYNGTWTQNGNTITLNYTDGGTTYNDTFSIVGNTLTFSITGGEVIGLAGGNPVYLMSNIQLVYTKQ